MNDQLKTFLTVTNLAKIQRMAFLQKEKYKQSLLNLGAINNSELKKQRFQVK